MRDYVRGERCLMELLQESLDDPARRAVRPLLGLPRRGCRRRCAGAPSAETVRRRRPRLLRGEVHVLEPRKMWPGGAFGSRGRIPPTSAPTPGRTLVFADAPEWRETVAAMFAAGRAPRPQEVLDACVRLLGQWRSSWPARPEVVVDLTAAGLAAADRARSPTTSPRSVASTGPRSPGRRRRPTCGSSAPPTRRRSGATTSTRPVPPARWPAARCCSSSTRPRRCGR